MNLFIYIKKTYAGVAMELESREILIPGWFKNVHAVLVVESAEIL